LHCGGQALRLVVHHDAICRDGLRDVLDRTLAQVLQIEVELPLDLIEDIACQADATGFRQGFEARRDVDAIAEDIAVLDDDVADIDADAKDDAPILYDSRIARPHCDLHIDGEGNGIDDAGELHERAVAHQFDSTAAILRHLGIEKILTMLLERRKLADFVLAHEAAVADHVEGEDRGETTFHAGFPWKGRLANGELGIYELNSRERRA